MLTETMHKMVQTNSNTSAAIAQKIEAKNQYIEILTFSKYQDIVDMLDVAQELYWTEFPVWARNLAFRLACLLNPQNAEIRRQAAADLRCFGPDWDHIADELDAQANKIERGLV